MLLRIKLENLLSFGPDSPALELENLNILIGPNASGKSNLIEAISLLRATPMSAASRMDMRTVIGQGGGVAEWKWKNPDYLSGGPLTLTPPPNSEFWPSVDVLVKQPEGTPPLGHFFSFTAWPDGFRVLEERVTAAALPVHAPENLLPTGGSILAAIRGPDRFPEYSALTDFYERITIYREWVFGRRSVCREPQQADARNDRLEEDFSNLSLYLSRLSRTPKARAAIVNGLRDLYEGVTDFHIHTEGGTVQTLFYEGNVSVPARRLSDGTLHYLCLLAILCDPNPPPLICLEEPELGLHPDILPKVADLLLEASERTQLIVTTHSDVLVDAMTERPEAIVTCEKIDGQTHMRRLSRDELTPWVHKYRLGELWSRGYIGANRW